MRLSILVYIFWLLMLVSCTDIDPDKIAGTEVYGHAGSGLKPEQYDYPSNSLRSIQKALLADGAEGVEIDVQMSRDSVIYLFHDQLLEGNTNGEGRVAEKTEDEIDLLFYRKSYLGTGKHPIVKLTDIIQWMNENAPESGLSINVQRQFPEDENRAFELEQIKQIENLCQAFANQTKLYIESPIQHQLDYLVGRTHDFRVMWDTDLTERNIDLALIWGYDGVVSAFDKATKEGIIKARENGMVSVLFGLRIYPNIREAFALEPDIVQTDNVSLTLSIRDDH